jgi:hypothetical protein
MNVTFGSNAQIESAVLTNLRQHVVVERNTSADITLSGSVKINE